MVDLAREASTLTEVSSELIAVGWTTGTMEPKRVAAYVAADDRVQDMSLDEIVDVLSQGVQRNLAIHETNALRAAARSVLLQVAGF
ncbi:MAG TPA: hypothetical protein VFG89_06670 [Coriobacteriia bacterium]|nr:hypothetical protein [Coriobacteriia bacterium]